MHKTNFLQMYCLAIQTQGNLHTMPEDMPASILEKMSTECLAKTSMRDGKYCEQQI